MPRRTSSMRFIFTSLVEISSWTLISHACDIKTEFLIILENALSSLEPIPMCCSSGLAAGEAKASGWLLTHFLSHTPLMCLQILVIIHTHWKYASQMPGTIASLPLCPRSHDFSPMLLDSALSWYPCFCLYWSIFYPEHSACVTLLKYSMFLLSRKLPHLTPSRWWWRFIGPSSPGPWLVLAFAVLPACTDTLASLVFLQKQ